ncbi:MAG: hypothetical protein JXO72_04410 [Vicinamibacteria bacterium]|nr:hypothetical protein [Vicinamibacteria bacterium]
MAKRGTSREINRRIALNLIRNNQTISRADLARLMGVRRCVAAVDIRASRTYMLVADLLGHPLLDIIERQTEKRSKATVESPAALIRIAL